MKTIQFRNPRRAPLLILLSILVFASTQCHKVDTSNPIKVDWSTLDCNAQNGADIFAKYVEIEGHLHAPGILLCSSKECQIDLYQPGLGQEAKNVLVMIPVAEAAQPNSLRKLPSQYESTDFLVWDESSKEIGHNQMATLYGELVRESTPSGNYNCKLQKPIRIIKKEG
ncbi:MAG: hypothetical protein KDK37_07480 [Leptospiraceae bacterium]|nr:hypothetical protein [Leptospiraceae bacterium]